MAKFGLALTINRGLDMCRQCFREKVSFDGLDFQRTKLTIQSKAIGFVKVRRDEYRAAVEMGGMLTIAEQLNVLHVVGN